MRFPGKVSAIRSTASRRIVSGLLLALSGITIPVPAQPGAAAPPVAGGAPAAPANPAPANLPTARVTFSQITEQRLNLRPSNGSIILTLAVSPEGLPPGAMVRQATVTKAMDNLGRLIGPGSMPPASMMSATRFSTMLGSYSLSTGFGFENRPAALQAVVGLAVAERDADSIQVLEGTVEIYVPTEANGGMVRLPNIVAHAGRIEEPALAKLGIQLNVFLDEAMFRQLQQEVFRSGSSAGSYGPNAVGMFYLDPAGVLAGWQLQDGQGRQLPSNGTSRGSSGGVFISQTRLSAPPPKDTQLVLFFTPAAALRTLPFRLENIPLP